MFLSLYMATSIHDIQNSTRNSQKLENGMEVGRRSIAQKKREIELISKKVWGKRKKEVVQKKKLMLNDKII